MGDIHSESLVGSLIYKILEDTCFSDTVLPVTSSQIVVETMSMCLITKRKRKTRGY